MDRELGARHRDLVAWAFALSGLSLASADVVALASLDGEQAEVAWFLPRIMLGAPLLAGSLAWSLAALRDALSARAGWLGRVAVDAICVAPFARGVLELVSGPKISVSAWRWPLATLAILAAVGGLVGLRRLARLVVQRTQGTAHADRAAAVALSTLIAATAGACVLTARLFHNLYPVFHQLVTFGALMVGAAAAYPVVALRPAPRRFAVVPALALLALVWCASGVLSWHAAAGRRVLAESAPFTGTFVPVIFRGDAAVRALVVRPAVGVLPQQLGPRRAPLASLRFHPDARKPHVLLVTVDAMRHDALDPASEYAPATPELRELAEQHALQYERAYASSNNTNRSLPVILSGVVNGTGLMPGEQFVTSAFTANGYDTRAWVTNNYQRAEDESVVLRKAGYFCRAFDTRYAAADEVTAWAHAALSATEPTFVWIHLSDAHAPYNLPAIPLPGGRVFANEYTRRVAMVDTTVARLLRSAHASGDVIWALTSDHGEAQGEHGTIGHDSTLYEEQIRVPLLLGGPGIERGRVREPVTTQDLAATLLHVAGANVPSDVTLLPPFGSAAQAPHASAPVLSYTNDACALVQGDWKLIADTRTQSLALFELTSDPGELKNRLSDEPERARRMLAALRDAGCRPDLSLLSASLER